MSASSYYCSACQAKVDYKPPPLVCPVCGKGTVSEKVRVKSGYIKVGCWNCRHQIENGQECKRKEKKEDRSCWEGIR